jgi:murein hydrolase activator
MVRIGAWLMAPVLFALVTAAWPQDRAELEGRLENLRGEIEQIRERLDGSLRERDQALDRLASADRAVSDAERARRNTRNEISDLESRIASLESEQQSLGESVAETASLLSRQLVLAYRQGGQSRLKLLLNQEDLRQLNRHLAYHGYLTRARVRVMDRLAEDLGALRQSQADLEQRRGELEALARRQGEEIESLAEARRSREQALVAVDARIRTEQQQLSELEQDAAELAELLDQLATALADIPPEIEIPAFADLRGQLPMPVSRAIAASVR